MNLETQNRESQLASLREEMEQLRRRELEAQRQELDRELVRRAYRIHELEQRIEQMEWEFHSSLSWRVARPLRALKALLAAVKRRIAGLRGH